MRIIGRILLTFDIGEPLTGFRAELSVVEGLVHPIVLGLAFLRRVKASILFGEDTMMIDQCKVVLSAPPPSPPPPHLAVFNPVTLQPGEMKDVDVYMSGFSIENQGHGLMVWSTLVKGCM